MTPFVRAIPQPITAGALAAQLASAKIIGDHGREIRGIASLSAARHGTLTFCDAGNAQDLLRNTQASVVIVPASTGPELHPDRTYIAVVDVRIAFIESVSRLLPGVGRPAMPALGVHPLAKIAEGAEIAPTASIGARVNIGPRTQVGPGAVIFDDCTIGADCVVGPCAVIGWVGLSYHDAADGRRLFFPHLGGVRIGDWVDIGANTCICRGMISDTTIGDQVKIGSLVYVSHGANVERKAWLSAGTAIAGHAHIGAGSLLGIGSVVIDNVKLEEGLLVGGGSVVIKDAQTGEKLVGVPARHMPGMRRFGPTPRE